MRMTRTKESIPQSGRIRDQRKILRIRRKILGWYDREKRDLPWRRTRDPYRIWIAEVMLHQTRVETVLPYYERFLKRFPDAGALARARLQTVLKMWEGLGYYGRARNLHRAAKIIVREHGGSLPDDPGALGRLPGLGAYSVGAIGSIAYGLPLPAVDGNVRRVLSRLFGIESDPVEPETRRTVDSLAEALVSRGRPPRPGDVNQALMDLGARICLPRRPRCPLCPLRSDCAARLAGQEESITGSARKPIPTAVMVGCIWAQRRGSALMARNPDNGLYGGLWELPGAELTENASPEESLSKRLFERAGLRVALGRMLEEISATLTHRRITYRIFEAKSVRPVKQTKKPPGAYAQIRWVGPDELDRLPLSRAQQRILHALLNR